MTNSKLFATVLAISIADELGNQVATAFQEVQAELTSLVVGFVTGRVRPEGTFAFEKNFSDN